MAKMKWDINGKGKGAAKPGEGGGQNKYEGPELPKGSWPVKIKRMTVGEIATKGENFGKPRISVLFEVQTADVKGKEQYHGCPVWDGLNVIESSVKFTNAFLHALTNGSESAKRAVEAAFWDDDKGPDFKRTKVERGNRAGEIDTHITKIGKYQINSPRGELMMQITTAVGSYNKKRRVEVTGYLPYEGPVESDDDDIDDDDDLDDEDDALDNVEDDDDDDGDDDADDDADDDSDDDDDEDSDEDDSDSDDDDDGDEDGDEDEDGDADEEPEKPAPAKRTPAKRGSSRQKPF